MDWNHNSMISLLQAYLIGTFRVWSQKFLGLQDHISTIYTSATLCCDIHSSLPESLNYHSMTSQKFATVANDVKKRQRAEKELCIKQA